MHERWLNFQQQQQKTEHNRREFSFSKMEDEFILLMKNRGERKMKRKLWWNESKWIESNRENGMGMGMEIHNNNKKHDTNTSSIY